MSEWKKMAADRRDIKAAKDEIEDRHANSKHKDTKRWCKGKVGREHKLEVKSYNELKLQAKTALVAKSYANGWYILFCTKCGKEVETHYPLSKRKKPEWLENFLNKEPTNE